MPKKLKLAGCRKTYKTFYNSHQKDTIVILEDWNAKVGCWEIPRVTGKFGLGVQNEAGQRLTVLSRENTDHSKHPFPTTQKMTLHMDITRWSKSKSLWLFVTPHGLFTCFVAQSCPTLCDPMDGSMPGFPVHHWFPELDQTYVHQVGDAIQPPHPLSSSFPPAVKDPASGSFPMNLFFASGGQNIGVSASASALPMNI